MAKLKKFWTLEQGLALLQKQAKKESLTLKMILHALSGKGRSLSLILLSIPFCQPLQIPGISTPFGLLIAVIGSRIIFGKHIWLPQKIMEKRVSKTMFETLTKQILKLVRKMKIFIHPRLFWMCHSPWMEKINGLLIVILGLFLALPLPIPFSNMSAAWSILLISLGMLEDDGVVVFLGYVISLITMVFFLFMGIAVKRLI